jgi:hypothetical protein
MFGLEGSGFIIAISVCLLLVGAVVYYFNTRVASLEKALVRQNQVLADFIQNVKASRLESRATPFMQHPSGNGATVEAVEAAQQYYSNTVPHEKVSVSDNEEVETEDDISESDSELESDDDDDDEEEEEGEEQSSTEDSGNLKIESVKMHGEPAFFGMLIDMTGDTPIENIVEKDGPQVIELHDDATDADQEVQSDNLTPVEVKAEPVEVNISEEKKVIKLSEVEDLDSMSSSLGSSLDNEEEDDDGVTIDSKQEIVIADYSKLKVTKLKELASKNGIKNAAKMKKAELVAALEANK